EFSVFGEHLDAPVFPVGDVHRAIPGDADGVYDAELRRPGIREAGRGRTVAVRIQTVTSAIVIVHWLVAECTPHPLKRSAIRIEHNSAVIAVTVGHEQLVSLRIDPYVRRPVQIGRVGISLALVAVPNL